MKTGQGEKLTRWIHGVLHCEEGWKPQGAAYDDECPNGEHDYRMSLLFPMEF